MVNPDRSTARATMWCSGSVLLEEHQCLLGLLTWQVTLSYSGHRTLISGMATLDIDFPLHLIAIRSKCANWVCRDTYMYWIGGKKIIRNKKIYPIHCLLPQWKDSNVLLCSGKHCSFCTTVCKVKTSPDICLLYMCLQSQNHSLLIIQF